MTTNISPLMLHPQLHSSPENSSLSTALTSRIQILKRKSRSNTLSSESSSFSLPFKKRRFEIIAVSDEDDDHRSLSTSLSRSTIHLSLPPVTPNDASKQQQQRDTIVTTPTLGIVKPLSVSNLTDKEIACITPVSNHKLQGSAESTVPKEVMVRTDGTISKTILSPSPHLVVSEPMQTRRSSRNNSNKDPCVNSIDGMDTKDQNKASTHHKDEETNPSQSVSKSKPKYSKQHTFDRKNDNNSNSSVKSISNDDNKCLVVKTNKNQHEQPLTNKRTGKSNSNSKRAPRDKLYRGSQDDTGEVEVRCLAISTRGKRCCYAAVACNGNEYCHRHSSFYSHSDPICSDTKTESLNVQTNRISDPVNETLSKPSTTSVSRRKRSSNTSQLSNRTAISDQRSPSSLSDLATELWQNRQVQISKGPYKSKIGTVVRWRNGWVTVELSEQETDKTVSKSKTEKGKSKSLVCHNRRSYELTLV